MATVPIKKLITKPIFAAHVDITALPDGPYEIEEVKLPDGLTGEAFAEAMDAIAEWDNGPDHELVFSLFSIFGKNIK
jgi:hypothetical protein